MEFSAVQFEAMTLTNALAESESDIIPDSSYCECELFTHKNKRSDRNQEMLLFEFCTPSSNASNLFLPVVLP